MPGAVDVARAQGLDRCRGDGVGAEPTLSEHGFASVGVHVDLVPGRGAVATVLALVAVVAESQEAVRVQGGSADVLDHADLLLQAATLEDVGAGEASFLGVFTATSYTGNCKKGLNEISSWEKVMVSPFVRLVELGAAWLKM